MQSAGGVGEVGVAGGQGGAQPPCQLQVAQELAQEMRRHFEALQLARAQRNGFVRRLDLVADPVRVCVCVCKGKQPR